MELLSVEVLQQIVSDQATVHANVCHQPHAGMSTLDVQPKLRAWEQQALALWIYLTGKPYRCMFLRMQTMNYPLTGLYASTCDDLETKCRDVKRAHRERAAWLQTPEDPLQVCPALLLPSYLLALSSYSHPCWCLLAASEADSGAIKALLNKYMVQNVGKGSRAAAGPLRRLQAQISKSGSVGGSRGGCSEADVQGQSRH
jgi:hypothetical protein